MRIVFRKYFLRLYRMVVLVPNSSREQQKLRSDRLFDSGPLILRLFVVGVVMESNIMMLLLKVLSDLLTLCFYVVNQTNSQALCNPKVNCHQDISTPCHQILDKCSPITLITYLLQIQNDILSSNFRSTRWTLPLRFS